MPLSTRTRHCPFTKIRCTCGHVRHVKRQGQDAPARAAGHSLGPRTPVLPMRNNRLFRAAGTRVLARRDGSTSHAPCCSSSQVLHGAVKGTCRGFCTGGHIGLLCWQSECQHRPENSWSHQRQNLMSHLLCVSGLSQTSALLRGVRGEWAPPNSLCSA